MSLHLAGFSRIVWSLAAAISLLSLLSGCQTAATIDEPQTKVEPSGDAASPHALDRAKRTTAGGGHSDSAQAAESYRDAPRQAVDPVVALESTSDALMNDAPQGETFTVERDIASPMPSALPEPSTTPPPAPETPETPETSGPLAIVLPDIPSEPRQASPGIALPRIAPGEEAPAVSAAPLRVGNMIGESRTTATAPVAIDAALDLIANSSAPRFAVRLPGEPMQVLDRAVAFRALATTSHRAVALIEVWEARSEPVVHSSTAGVAAIGIPTWLLRWDEEVARREAEARTREASLDEVRHHRQAIQSGVSHWLEQHRLDPMRHDHPTRRIEVPALRPSAPERDASAPPPASEQ
jgi:hypothetical protein